MFSTKGTERKEMATIRLVKQEDSMQNRLWPILDICSGIRDQSLSLGFYFADPNTISVLGRPGCFVRLFCMQAERFKGADHSTL